MESEGEMDAPKVPEGMTKMNGVGEMDTDRGAMKPIIIDLSNGWDTKEISKLITALPCSEADKQIMEAQNKVFKALDHKEG